MESHMILNDPWEATIAFPLDDTDLWSLVEDDLKQPCIDDDDHKPPCSPIEIDEKKPFENVVLIKTEKPSSPAFTCEEEEEPFSATWLERKIDLTVFDSVSADVTELYSRSPQNHAPPPASNAGAFGVKLPLKGEVVSQTDDFFQEFGMVLEAVAGGLTPPNSPPQYQVQSNGFVPTTIPPPQDAAHLASEMATIDELIRERAEEALDTSPSITVLSPRQSSFPPTSPQAPSESMFACFKEQAVPVQVTPAFPEQTASAFLSDQQPQWIEVTVCHPSGLIIPSSAPPSPAYSIEPHTPTSMTPLSPVMTTVTLPGIAQVAPSTSAQSPMSNSLPPTPATSSASSPPPSPASSLDDSDPEWQPSLEDKLTTKMPSSKKRASKSKPYQKQRRQSRNRVAVDNVEEKRLRKKEQNKNAATRYRMKKKAQAEGLGKEEQDLADHNATLRGKATDVKREIRYLKGLMRDLFKAKGILK